MLNYSLPVPQVGEERVVESVNASGVQSDPPRPVTVLRTKSLKLRNECRGDRRVGSVSDCGEVVKAVSEELAGRSTYGVTTWCPKIASCFISLWS
ncbi:hypothetical protein V6N13_102641 [Hibiscus sabdariffa]